MSGLDIDNHSIFDLEELGENVRFGWALRLANRLHVRTRESFLRRELLFEVGDCYDPLLVSESARILRAHRFIGRAEVFEEIQGDGNRRLTVETQDEWSTQVDLGVSFDGGFALETLEVTEENFLGRGMLFEFFFRERREQRDLGLLWTTSRLLGSRWDAWLTGGRTRVGDLYGVGLGYPFVGEVGRFAMLQSFDRAELPFSYSLGPPEDAANAISHVVVPFTLERVSIAAAARTGRPGAFRLVGVGMTRESLGFSRVPADVEAVRDSRFGEPETATDSLVAPVIPQITDGWRTRLNFLLGHRSIRFAEFTGLDAMSGIQDVALGTDVGLTIGLSLGELGSGGAFDSDDLYGRLEVFGGARSGPLLLNARGRLEARRIFQRDRADWRDVLGEVDMYGYLVGSETSSHTLFARVSGAGGWSTSFPFQLTLGGREALRGFREDDEPGGRRLVLGLEDRAAIAWPDSRVFELGYSLFAEAGRMWKGDAPFGRDSPWRGTVGAGLRLGFPRGSRSVLRIDVALPLAGSVSLSDLVLRVSARELIGLLQGFDDEQMVRSRFTGLGTDAFVPQR